MKDDRDRVRKGVEAANAVHPTRIESLHAAGVRAPSRRFLPAAALALLTILLTAAAATVLVRMDRPGDEGGDIGASGSATATLSTSAGVTRTPTAPPTPFVAGTSTAPAKVAPAKVTSTASPSAPDDCRPPSRGQQDEAAALGADDWIPEPMSEAQRLEELASVPYIFTATIESVEPVRWNTPDGCAPVDWPEDLRHSTMYAPVNLRVERVLYDPEGAIPPGVRYGMWHSDGGVRHLEPGRYVLFGWQSTMRGTEDRSLRLIVWALPVDAQGRITRPSGEKQPLAAFEEQMRQLALKVNQGGAEPTEPAVVEPTPPPPTPTPLVKPPVCTSGELAEARRRWQDVGIHSYDLTLRVEFEGADNGEWRLKVMNGAIVRATHDPGDGPRESDEITRRAGRFRVERLYDFVTSGCSVADEDSGVTARFDPNRGYLTYYTSDAAALDGDYRLEVLSFQAR